jgi:hypothetical protein
MLSDVQSIASDMPRPAIRIRLNRTLWPLAVIAAFLYAQAGVLRLAEGGEWANHLPKVTNPLLVGIGVLTLIVRRGIPVDALSLVAGLSIVQATVMGLAHDGPLRFFVSHAFSAVFFVTLYAAARTLEPSDEEIERMMRGASWALLVAYGIAIALLAALMATGRATYVGANCWDLLLPAAWALNQRRFWPALASAALIVGSGNRGVTLALLAMAGIAGLSWARRRPWLLLAAGAGAAAVVLALAAAPALESDPTSSLGAALVGKWSRLDPTSERFDLDAALSGRLAELEVAHEVFAAEPLRWLSGWGFGFHYTQHLEIAGVEPYDIDLHFVHISPANLLFQYGLPMGALLLFLMARAVFNGLRRTEEGSGGRAMALYAAGAFIAGLTAYTWAIDSLFALALGTLAAAPRPRPR